jgi:hypothetical protein
MLRLILFLIALALASAQLFFATSSQAGSDCDGAFADGTQKTTKFYNSEYGRLWLAAKLSTITLDQAKQDYGGSALTQYGKFDYTNNQYKNWQQEVRKSIDVEQIINNQTSLLINSGDENILRAWTACIESEGLHAYLEAKGDKAAVLHFIYRVPNPTGAKFCVGEATINEAKGEKNKWVTGGNKWLKQDVCPGTNVKRGVSIKRNKNAPIQVHIVTDAGDIIAYLPYPEPVPDIKPEPKPPVESLSAYIIKGGKIQVLFSQAAFGKGWNFGDLQPDYAYRGKYVGDTTHGQFCFAFYINKNIGRGPYCLTEAGLHDSDKFITVRGNPHAYDNDGTLFVTLGSGKLITGRVERCVDPCIYE